MSDADFAIDPDIRVARTLPARVYSDPEIFRLQRDRIFARTWHYAGIDDLVALMRTRLETLPFRELVYDAAGARDYFVNANWALYLDNYLEGFHIPYVHSSLAQTLDYGEYAVELGRFSVLQLGIAKPGEPAFAFAPTHPDHGRAIAAYYYWLFPTTMFNVYPWGVSVNVVTPLGVDRTRVSFLPFVWDESRRETGAGAGLDRVEREDEAIVEAVQRGVRSRLYHRGRYSPTPRAGALGGIATRLWASGGRFGAPAASAAMGPRGFGPPAGGPAILSRSMAAMRGAVKVWTPGTTPAGMPVGRTATRSSRGCPAAG